LYVLRQSLVPWLLGFGVVTGTLQVDLLVDYLDLWIRRGVPLWAVGQLFLFGLGWMSALAVPCGVLVASLIVFGRMSQDSEIVAVKSSGINLFRLLIAPLAAAAGLSMGLAAFNTYVLPETNHAYANLLADIGRKRPTIRLKVGVFNSDFPGFRLLVDSLDTRTNRMWGVSILEFDEGVSPSLILARQGHLGYSPDGQTAVLTLRDGELHQEPADADEPGTYRVMRFDVHVINVAGAGELLERQIRDSRSEREMTTAQLEREIGYSRRQLGDARDRLGDRLENHGIDRRLLPWIEGRAGPSGWWLALQGLFDPAARMNPSAVPATLVTELTLARMEIDTYRRRIAQLEVEVHKKYSLACACVVFVLVGAPLGVRVRRGGLTVGFLSLLFFLFYFICLVAGESLAERLLLSPVLAMWLPDVVLGGLGLAWTLSACDVDWRRLARRRAGPAAPGPATAPAAAMGGGA
jgi:lipopolysaccharide export system permease protein